MLIPGTYQVALLLSILTALCWGSWANTQKLSGPKWRFELFYVDYTIGTFLAVLLACFTVGSWDQNDITFLDSLIGIAMRKIALAMLAGMIFNVANVLLVAAISIAGMSVAFPVGIGLATVVGVVWSYLLNPQGNATMLWAGLAFLILGMIVNARAYSMMAIVRRSQEVTTAELKPQSPSAALAAKRVRKTGKTKSTAGKGITLSLLCGLLMGCFYPVLQMSREGDLAISPYAALLSFAGGLLFSSMLLVPFLMNFPVEGEPLEFSAYFKGRSKVHLLGILGGMIWMTGLVANVLAASVPKTQNVGPAISYALGQGATLVSALWGVFVWKEFAGTGARVRMQLVVMFVLLMIALALISLAPLY
jgi:glucose uptake protein